jgi:hypothetical protein
MEYLSFGTWYCVVWRSSLIFESNLLPTPSVLKSKPCKQSTEKTAWRKHCFDIDLERNPKRIYRSKEMSGHPVKVHIFKRGERGNGGDPESKQGPWKCGGAWKQHFCQIYLHFFSLLFSPSRFSACSLLYLMVARFILWPWRWRQYVSPKRW